MTLRIRLDITDQSGRTTVHMAEVKGPGAETGKPVGDQETIRATVESYGNEFSEKHSRQCQALLKFGATKTGNDAGSH